MASIKERNGKYCVIYTYTDENGNKKQKWETYKTKAKAKQRKKEIEYKTIRNTIWSLQQTTGFQSVRLQSASVSKN